MQIHHRAWEGIEICIFGAVPTLPMQIEQAISEAMPALEVHVSSFEVYQDAYEFCKNTGNVGLLILTENTGAMPFVSAFRELSAHAAKREWPCYGLIVHQGQESALTMRTVAKTPALLDYISVDDLLQPDRCPATLQEIWALFATRFEQDLLPKALQSSFISFAERTKGLDAVHFLTRTLTVLQSNASISWLEEVACRWEPFVTLLGEAQPSFLAPHTKLQRICEGARHEVPSTVQDLVTLLTSSVGLPKKITACAGFLEIERERKRLHETIGHLASLGKPGSASLLRTLARNKEGILAIANDAESISNTSLKAG